MQFGIKKIITAVVLLGLIVPQAIFASAGTYQLGSFQTVSASAVVQISVPPLRVTVISALPAKQPQVQLGKDAACGNITEPDTNLVQDTATAALLNRPANCLNLALGQVHPLTTNLAVKRLDQPQVRVVVLQRSSLTEVSLSQWPPSKADSIIAPVPFTPGLAKSAGLYVSLAQEMKVSKSNPFYHALSLHRLLVMRC